MKELITDYVKQCEVCNLNKYERNPSKIKFNITENPTSPMEIIHCDTFSLRKKIFLTIIDKFSKFALAYEIVDRKSTTIISKFKNYFAQNGIPAKIILDNAAEFTSEIFKKFIEMHNIKLHFTTPKASTGNSPIERFHSTITEIARIIYSQNKTLSISELMDESLLTYNNSIHSSTNLTPFELYKGHLKDLKQLPDKINQHPQEYLEHIRENYNTVKNIVREYNSKIKTNVITKANQNRDDPKVYEPGETIFELNTTRDKLTPKYIKHIIVQDNDTNVITNKRTVHKNRIKK